MLASFGTSRNAKRTTIIHLMFNLFGTVLFTIVCMTTPLTDLVASFTPGSPDSQIANMHTLFNIVTTLILLPFGTLLVKVAMRILPDRNEGEKEGMHLAYLVPGPALTRQEHPIGFSAMYVNQLRQEISRMLGMARQNVDLAFEAVLATDPRRLEQAEETEEYIDFLNKEICRYISDVIVNETNEKDSAAVSAYYLISGNIERIGDHAMNICEYTQLLKRKNIHFSEDARAELRKMQNVCLEAIDILETEPGVDVDRWLERVASFEQKIDDMTGEFRDSQLDRMRRGACSDEGGIIFSELLTDFERIGDHVLNIAEQRAAAATASV